MAICKQFDDEILSKSISKAPQEFLFLALFSPLQVIVKICWTGINHPQDPHSKYHYVVVVFFMNNVVILYTVLIFTILLCNGVAVYDMGIYGMT